MDYVQARQVMVEAQLRPFEVTDHALLRVLREMPRERFLPEPLRGLAYSDLDLNLGHGRLMLRPRLLGRLIQALEVQPNDRTLEIAGGSGFGAAVLSRLAKSATMLEPITELTLMARTAMDHCKAGAVQIVSTDLRDGWREGAPYDAILVQVGAEVVPEVWLDQLNEGGRLAVIVRTGSAGTALLFRKAGGVVASRRILDAQIDVAAGLEKPPSFVF